MLTRATARTMRVLGCEKEEERGGAEDWGRPSSGRGLRGVQGMPCARQGEAIKVEGERVKMGSAAKAEWIQRSVGSVESQCIDFSVAIRSMGDDLGVYPRGAEMNAISARSSWMRRPS